MKPTIMPVSYTHLDVYKRQLLGSYMICREEQDDTLKSLRLIPVNETKLTTAKMIVALVFSMLVYLLLFMITFVTEAILHLSDLSMAMFSEFLKMYLFCLLYTSSIRIK